MVLVTCLMSSPPAPPTLTWPHHSNDVSPLLFFEVSCALSWESHCLGSFFCLEHTPPDIGKTESLTSFQSLFKPETFVTLTPWNATAYHLPLLGISNPPLCSPVSFLHSTYFLLTYRILAFSNMLIIYWLSSLAKIKALLEFFICVVLYLTQCKLFKKQT